MNKRLRTIGNHYKDDATCISSKRGMSRRAKRKTSKRVRRWEKAMCSFYWSEDD